MGLGGIIAGALSGGAGQAISVADTQIDKQKQMDLRQYEHELALERMQQQERLRLEGVRVENDPNSEIGKARLGYQKKSDQQRVETETAGYVDRETKLQPVRTEGAKALKRAENEIEQENLRNYGKDPEVRKGAQAMAADKESTAAKVNAAATSYELTRKKAVDTLLDAASRARAAGNEDGAKSLRQQAADMRGADPNKNFADVQQGGRTLADMAKAEEAPLNDPVQAAQMSEKEKTDRKKRATELRRLAEQMITGVAEKKAVDTGGAPAPTAGAPKVGTVVDGYRFLGGNPNDKKSWAPASQSGAGSVE